MLDNISCIMSDPSCTPLKIVEYGPPFKGISPLLSPPF